MSLYNEMRPHKFDAIIGHSVIKKALKKFVKEPPNKRPHAYLFHGPKGCIRGDTLIFDPIDKSTLTIKERWKRGCSFNVLSFSSSGKMVVAKASPPIQYSPARMFRVDTSQSTFYVTSEHRFLFECGEYFSLKELFGKQFDQFPLLSIAGTFQEVQHQDVVTGSTTIKKITEVGKENYYDFHVPIFNNYWAGGLIHHNCGKTTFARILAKELGCVGINLVELDAANTRGIDTTRSIADDARLLPMDGESRVFIFDESHQLTGPAQQSLLKVTEDAPLQSYFIFCTTNPEKIIDTLKNRCTPFQVSPLNDEEITELLLFVLDKLGMNLSEEILGQLVMSAEGCPREAITSLELVLTVDLEDEQFSLLQEALAKHETIELCRALLGGKSWGFVSEIYKGLPTFEPENIRRAVLGYMKSVLLRGNHTERAASIIATFEESTYNSGEPMLVRMLYDVSRKGGKG